MNKQFRQIVWDGQLQEDWLAVLRLAIREDLGEQGDRTTEALVPEDRPGRAAIVAREAGILAGMPAVGITLGEIEPRLRWSPKTEDGQTVRPGQQIGLIAGPARGLLAAERLVLNMLGRLSGVATLTHRYVEAVAGTKAGIYDTRKTTPGWRRLEKYAVRCGGGYNHRTGLFEAVLIKDNHLALCAGWGGRDGASDAAGQCTPAEAVARARQFVRQHVPKPAGENMICEVEVDTLEQLDDVLPAGPDIVLLDNMSEAELREAVVRRDACDPAIELEASGGIDLDTVAHIARTGVERISVGALTHSAPNLDFGLDWLPANVAEK